MLFVPLEKHSFFHILGLFDVLLIEAFQKTLSYTDSTRHLNVFHIWTLVHSLNLYNKLWVIHTQLITMNPLTVRFGQHKISSLNGFVVIILHAT